MKTVTYTEIDYSELENIINEYYGIKDFSIPASEEFNNDTKHSYSAKKRTGEISDWEKRKLDDLRACKYPNYCLSTIIEDLVRNDILPEGEYLVDVSW